jgi:hypothetical protein
MFYEDFILSQAIWILRSEFIAGINLVQVVTADERLVHYFVILLQNGHLTKRVPLEEPVWFTFQVNVDDLVAKSVIIIIYHIADYN